MEGIIPSSEQQAIIDAAVSGKNIIVDAVAGSGKTTTILMIAQRYKGNILQLTYNAKLKEEVREKAKNIKNLEVHSYHSLGLAYYINPTKNDDDLVQIIYKDYPFYEGKFVNIDMLIVDEAQDMKYEYYKMVKKFISDAEKISNKKITLCFFGDSYQCVNKYKGADERYLILADKIWEEKQPFEFLTLKTSLRLTIDMSNFINNIVLNGTDRIKSNKIGDNSVVYIRCQNVHDNLHLELGDYIHKHINNGTYTANDIMILSYSIKKNKEDKPIHKLEKYLRYTKNLSCYTPNYDDGTPSPEEMNNRICFLSLNSSKGLERKLVIFYGFDNFYYNNINPKAKNCCPAYYVGLTRASEQLIIIEDESNKQPWFIKNTIDNTIPYIRFRYLPSKNSQKMCNQIKNNGEIKRICYVSEISKYINILIMVDISEKIKYLNITPYSNPTILKSKIDTPKGIRDVSDINGIVIPAIYEYMNTISHKCSIYDVIKNHPDYNKYKQFNPLPGEDNVQMFIKYGLLYDIIKNGYISRAFDIFESKNLQWLNLKEILEINENMKKNINSKSKNFEYLIKGYIQYDYCNFEIYGQIDMIDDDYIWEFKCVDELKIEHYIQLLFYILLYYNEKKQIKKGRLYNIKTNEINEINMSIEEIKHVCEQILLHKYLFVDNDKSDDKFIKDCLEDT